MAINVDAANGQARQLETYADNLATVKKQLSTYKTSLIANWQGKEVTYITQGIDKTITEISSLITQLNSLGTDIRTTAGEIRKEEEEAEAAAVAAALAEAEEAARKMAEAAVIALKGSRT